MYAALPTAVLFVQNLAQAPHSASLEYLLGHLRDPLPQLTRSALHRCLVRHGISRLSSREPDGAEHGKFAPTGLRHTSATFDAPHRDMKDLQADLRHNSLSTTQNTYYNSLDEQRAHSVKHLRIKE